MFNVQIGKRLVDLIHGGPIHARMVGRLRKRGIAVSIYHSVYFLTLNDCHEFFYEETKEKDGWIVYLGPYQVLVNTQEDAFEVLRVVSKRLNPSRRRRIAKYSLLVVLFYFLGLSFLTDLSSFGDTSALNSTANWTESVATESAPAGSVSESYQKLNGFQPEPAEEASQEAPATGDVLTDVGLDDPMSGN